MSRLNNNFFTNNPNLTTNRNNRVYTESQSVPFDTEFPNIGAFGPSSQKPFEGSENLSSLISNDGNDPGRRSQDLKDIDPSGRNAVLDIPSFLFYPQDLGKNRRHHHFITFNIYQGTSDEVRLQTRENNLKIAVLSSKNSGVGFGSQLAGSGQPEFAKLIGVGYTIEQAQQLVKAFVGATGTLQSLGITTDERISAIERVFQGELNNLYKDALYDENGVKRVEEGVVSSALSSVIAGFAAGGGVVAGVGADTIEFFGSLLQATTRDNFAPENLPRRNYEEVGVSGRKVNKNIKEQALLIANRRFTLANVKSKDTICLHMPLKITFNDNLMYSEEEMGGAKVLLDAVVGNRGAISAGFEKAGVNKVSDLINKGTAFVGLETANIQAVRNAATRSVSNPRRESMFKEVGMRTHAFTFDFAARNPEEADTILNIIRMFRYHAHPGIRGGGGHFLTFPAEFEIGFHTITEGGIVVTNDNLPKIPRLALTSIQVDYSNAGDFKTFKDAKPAFIRLDLQFQEMEQLTNEHIINGY